MAGVLEGPKLAAHVVVKLHDTRTGRLSGIKVARFLALSPEEVAPAVGVSGKTLRRDPAGKHAQDGLAQLTAIISRLVGLLGEGGARVWLHAPHPLLDDRTPISLIKGGEVEVVLDLLIAAEKGQTT